MARSRTPRPAHTDTDRGYDHQQHPRSIPERSSRPVRARLNQPPTETHYELEHDEILMKALNQFQTNWGLWEDRRQSSTPPNQARSRFSHPAPSRPYLNANFVYTFDNGSKVGSLPRDRQSHQHNPSYPPPSSFSQNRKTQQRGSSRGVYEDNHESSHRPLSASPSHVVERFVQGGSNWRIASVQPRDYESTPIRQPPTGTPSDPPAEKLHGLTRRPRVQSSRARGSRVRGSRSSSFDLETSQAMEMDSPVMSVSPKPEGSGSHLSSRFVHPPAASRPITIGGSDGGGPLLGVSPLPHVNPEAEQARSRIKAPGRAGSTSTNTHSIPKREPHTRPAPSLMNDMEEQLSSSSPVSTPKAPPLDQQHVIRGDLQQEDERLIAGRRTDPRISFREAAAVEDRKSLEFVLSMTPPPGVSHLQTQAVPMNDGDGRKQPGQQALFKELYHMLQPLDSDPLRSRVDRKTGEGITRQDVVNEEGSAPDTPRGPEGSEQALHVDILLAQRVVRDAMQEDEECLGQSCMLSASECGEEAVDSSSNWVECGLDRKHSTRSVFDWGYA